MEVSQDPVRDMEFGHEGTTRRPPTTASCARTPSCAETAGIFRQAYDRICEFPTGKSSFLLRVSPWQSPQLCENSPFQVFPEPHVPVTLAPELLRTATWE